MFVRISVTFGLTKLQEFDRKLVKIRKDTKKGIRYMKSGKRKEIDVSKKTKELE